MYFFFVFSDLLGGMAYSLKVFFWVCFVIKSMNIKERGLPCSFFKDAGSEHGINMSCLLNPQVIFFLGVKLSALQVKISCTTPADLLSLIGFYICGRHIYQ